ncbi:MAG: type VI secretion system baseplate subunit TssF [Pseudomonadota bacterium]
MKQAFKTAYERELALLKQRAAAFAEDHPGLADRLGGLLEENLDPAIAGLLEGSAFLAARVQLNIDQQFRTFSTELLEQLCPEMTAPLPSAMLVTGTVPGKPEDIKDGRTIEAGQYMEAAFNEGSRRVACRFRTAEPITFWPIKLDAALYHGTSTQISALGFDGPDFENDAVDKTEAGLVLTFKTTAPGSVGDLKADTLPLYFTGAPGLAKALYQQVFADLTRVTLRWEDKMGTPHFVKLPKTAVEQVGFDPDFPLYGRDERLFPGNSLLLEYFSFPRKFWGMRLCGLQQAIKGIPTQSVQMILEFARPNGALTNGFKAEDVRLFTVPAVNLFDEEAKPISLDKRAHRHLVSPNRSPATHYEVIRIKHTRAQYDGLRDKVVVEPLYALPAAGTAARETLYFSSERQRRSLSQQERRLGGTRYRYEGTETWLTLYEPPTEDEAALIFVTAECSNRHLPEILPLSEGTFYLIEDRQVAFTPAAPHSVPRDAAAELETDAPHRVNSGDNYWRLISLLSLSQRGFLGPKGQGNVAALHEVLRLFADISDQLSEAQITALTGLEARSATRTIERPDGFHPARGMEVTVIFDEDKLDTATMVAMGAVLDRFFADHAAINSFTETVLKNLKDRIVKRFPPRGGTGPLA